MIDIGVAIQFAGRSLHHRSKHAAIIFYEGEIIGIANNSKSTHAEIKAFEVARINAVHLLPETNAITLKQMIRRFLLISVAIDKNGKLKLAKPCPRCHKFLSNHGITNIRYSTGAQAIVRMK